MGFSGYWFCQTYIRRSHSFVRVVLAAGGDIFHYISIMSYKLGGVSDRTGAREFFNLCHPGQHTQMEILVNGELLFLQE